MELNFVYKDGNYIKKISFNATEITDQTFLMSQVGGFSDGTKNVGWCPKLNNFNFRQTEPRYFGTTGYRSVLMGPGITGDYSRFFPNELVTAIKKYPAENTYTLTTSSNFLGTKGTSGSPYYYGVPLLIEADHGYKTVCNFLWAYREQPIPGQTIHSYIDTGFWAFPYPSDEFPDTSMYNQSPRNEIQFQGEVPEVKMSLWIITVQDDITGSVSYGQEFKLFAQVINGFVSFIDIRLLDGTYEGGQPVPNGSDTKKNSTPNGWGGSRNPYSEEVSPTKAPNALKDSVNSTINGMHLYKLNNDQYNALTGLFWSDQFADMVDKEKFTPAMGVLSVHRLPYVPDSTGGTTTVHMCGRDLYNQNWKPFEGFSKDYFYGIPITGGQDYESDPIDVEPFFNSFLDFEPYTHVSIMLPFIGIVPISTNRVMGGSIYVNYILDNRNGNCVAQVFTKSMRNMQESVANKWSLLGQWSGNTKMPMALFGNNNGASDVMNSVRGFASSAAGSVLMGVAGVAAPEVAAAGVAASAISSGIGIATRQRPTQTISTIGTETACMSNLECRLIITRPVDVTPGHTETVDGSKVHIPDSLLTQSGLASCSGGTVNDYTGMTIGYIRGSIEGATETEMLAIRNMFLGGVIV